MINCGMYVLLLPFPFDAPFDAQKYSLSYSSVPFQNFSLAALVITVSQDCDLTFHNSYVVCVNFTYALNSTPNDRFLFLWETFHSNLFLLLDFLPEFY